MARPRKELDVKGEGDQVRSRLKTETADWKRKRLIAIKLGLEGKLDMEEIAERVGCARSAIQRYFDAYRSAGVEGLLTRNSGAVVERPRRKLPMK